MKGEYSKMDDTKIMSDLEIIRSDMLVKSRFEDADVISRAKERIREKVTAEALVEDIVKPTITKEEFFEEYAIQSIEKRGFLRTIIELRRELQEVKKLSDKL